MNCDDLISEWTKKYKVVSEQLEKLKGDSGNRFVK